MWLDGLGDAFCQADLWEFFETIPEDKQRAMASALIGVGFSAREQATYTPSYPNPLEDEVARLKRRVAELETDERIMREHIGKDFRNPSVEIDRHLETVRVWYDKY